MNTHRTIVVADHHKSVFVCQVLDRETGEVIRKTLKSERPLLEPFLKQLPGPVLVFVEACRAWEWVSDLCEDLGHEFRLVNPRDMPEIAKSVKKTDRNDVEAMVRRLLVEGDLPRSYRATRVERERRSLSRRLSDLRDQRRKGLLKIHAVADAQGMPARKQEFVKPEWREAMKSSLSPDAWLDLEVLLEMLDLAMRLSESVESRLIALSEQSKNFHRLKTIPGVGPVIAATILAEATDITRFSKARQFAAFSGLVPRVRASGGKSRCGRITKSGPADLRWALGQAVMVGQRCKEPSAAVLLCRRKKQKRRPAKVAICAGANKLARIVWAMLVRGEDYRSVTKVVSTAA